VTEVELPLLQDIERAAGAAFAAIGMTEIADDEPPSLAQLRGYQRDGRAWVAIEDGSVAAYLIAVPVDGYLHIEQVSVHPAHAHQRIGLALIDHAAGWSIARGLAGLTLTTFAEVPWNAPYYERCGFRVLADAELTPGLRQIRAREAAHGLDRWPRACMLRELTAPRASVR